MGFSHRKLQFIRAVCQFINCSNLLIAPNKIAYYFYISCGYIFSYSLSRRLLHSLTRTSVILTRDKYQGPRYQLRSFLRHFLSCLQGGYEKPKLLIMYLLHTSSEYEDKTGCRQAQGFQSSKDVIFCLNVSKIIIPMT